MRIGVSTAAAGLLLGGLVAPSAPSPAAPPPATAASAADAPAVRTRPVPVTPAGRTAGGSGPVAELTAQRTAPFRMVGVTWDPASTPPDVAVRVRLHTAAGWGGWERLEYVADEGPAAETSGSGRAGTAPLWVGRSDGVAVRVGSSSGRAPADVRLVTVDPGTQLRSAAQQSPASGDPITRAPRFPQIPRIIGRSQWGANPSMGNPCWTPKYGRSAKMVFVHHTAGSSRYSVRESPAIVRSIYAYHTQGQHWCDIGYNALVDRFGNIYAGRRGGMRKPVRGAHAGDWNTNSVGVSLMGNFVSAEPSPRMRNALVRFIGWRLGTSFNPVRGTVRLNGERFARISGHRDAMATSCPGGNVYKRLPSIRQRVANYLSRYRPKAERKAKRVGSKRTGMVFVGERRTHGGKITRFDHGRVYVKKRLGAHWLAGRVLDRYRRLGGPDGRLGWPRSDVEQSAVRSMRVAGFRHGRVYVPREQPLRVLYGRVLDRYRRLNFAAGRLGAPTSSIRSVSGGHRATFRHGVIRWDRSSDSISVDYE